MEQMEVLLNVPTISKNTVSSTPKTAVTDDDKSFADLYEQNIHESKSSNTETTQRSSTKNDESVDNSAKSEKKVESKIDENAKPKTENAEENVDQNIVAMNWLNILDLAADSSTEQKTEIVIDADTALPVNGEAQITASYVENKSTSEPSLSNDNEGEMPAAVPTEAVPFSGNKVEKATLNNDTKAETLSVPADAVSTFVSESTVENIAEEKNDSEIVVNTVRNEVVTQTANAVTKQTTDTTNINGEFSTMMTEDIPQSNLQENVMTQIEDSLGKIVKTGSNEIRIQLEPEHLGVLNIRVIAGKDGTQVFFKADSHQSSQLIAGQTETLKAMLNEAGLKVDQIVVNDFSFSQKNYQDQQTFEQQNGKGNKFYKGTNGMDVQLETYDAGYEMPQTIVGLNYLI